MAKRNNPAPPVTKLAPPLVQGQLLPRPDVLAALCGVVRSKLAVVTAPTGAGKSTLLGQAHVALAASGMDVCWLSLDAGDNVAPRFAAHLIAALQHARPGTGADAQDLLASTATVEDVLAALINDLTANPRGLALFLDDYQLIGHADTHAALGYFLHYSPASVRVVIASQEALPLSLARLKGRDAVIELDFDDLRFRPAEVRAYLSQGLRVAPTEAQVQEVTAQTEGWVCALQLAALALDGAGPLPAAAGGARDYADALLDEVFARQAPETQEFLVATAVLAQFSVPLAEAVWGRAGAGAMIVALERGNLFVVRLDDTREWFRYHHLFSAFLRKRLALAGAARAAALHRAAAAWCAAHGQGAEALGYALAAGDMTLAVRLLEAWGRSLVRAASFKELAQWLDALPRAAVRGSAALCVLDAWAQLYLGDPVAASEAIRTGEAALRLAPAEAPPAPPGLVHELQILRSMCGVTRYDLPDVAGLTPDLPQAFGSDDPLSRAYAHVVLGYAARLEGRLPEARQRYEDAMRIADVNEDIVVSLMARYNIAMVHHLEARPDHAAEGLLLWLSDTRNRRWLRSGSAGFLKAAHAIMLLEAGRADDALADAGEAIELLDVTRTYAYVGIALSIRAQAHAMRGDAAAAKADLARARQIGRAQRLERVLFRAALAGARIAVDAGAPDEARALLDEAHAVLEQTGQTRMPLPSENHAMHDAVLAAHLHRAGRHGELAVLAAGALATAGRAGRVRHRIEFLLWQALAHAGTGDVAAAVRCAGQAIDLAAAGNVLLPFLQAGAAVLPLIEARRSGGARSAFAVRVAGRLEAHPAPLAAPQRRKPALHQREVQILQLLGQGLRNREIGVRLMVSEETVKWYLKKLFETLEVGNRTHALVRAREWGILG